VHEVAKMAGVQAKIDSMQVRQDPQQYVNVWHTTLLKAVSTDCPCKWTKAFVTSCVESGGGGLALSGSYRMPSYWRLCCCMFLKVVAATLSPVIFLAV
jgi:hypothetical protein